MRPWPPEALVHYPTLHNACRPLSNLHHACRPGFFCPLPSQLIPCPSGSFCPQGSIRPTTCDMSALLASAPLTNIPTGPRTVRQRVLFDGNPLGGNFCPLTSPAPTLVRAPLLTCLKM